MRIAQALWIADPIRHIGGRPHQTKSSCGTPKAPRCVSRCPALAKDGLCSRGQRMLKECRRPTSAVNCCEIVSRFRRECVERSKTKPKKSDIRCQQSGSSFLILRIRCSARDGTNERTELLQERCKIGREAIEKYRSVLPRSGRDLQRRLARAAPPHTLLNTGRIVLITKKRPRKPTSSERAREIVDRQRAC